MVNCNWDALQAEMKSAAGWDYNFDEVLRVVSVPVNHN